jgi:hypothetical protein
LPIGQCGSVNHDSSVARQAVPTSACRSAAADPLIHTSYEVPAVVMSVGPDLITMDRRLSRDMRIHGPETIPLGLPMNYSRWGLGRGLDSPGGAVVDEAPSGAKLQLADCAGRFRAGCAPLLARWIVEYRRRRWADAARTATGCLTPSGTGLTLLARISGRCSLWLTSTNLDLKFHSARCRPVEWLHSTDGDH